jgi:hypothetical protein
MAYCVDMISSCAVFRMSSTPDAFACAQLGDDGVATDRTSPPAGDVLTGVASVRVGQQHSCALLTNGEVRCWGVNAQGQASCGPTWACYLHCMPCPCTMTYTLVDCCALFGSLATVPRLIETLLRFTPSWMMWLRLQVLLPTCARSRTVVVSVAGDATYMDRSVVLSYRPNTCLLSQLRLDLVFVDS